MSGDNLLERNRSLFHHVKSKIDFSSHDARAVTNNLKLIEKLGRFAWRNHPGIFYDADIETLLLRYGKELEKTVDVAAIANHLNKVIDQRKEFNTLHIATEIGSAGGHTRVINQMIRRSKEENQGFVLTGSDVSGVPEWFGKQIAPFAEIHSLLKYGSLLERATALRLLSSRFKRVIVYSHPYDVVPTLAFSNENQVPVAFENHAHSWFWYGMSVADLVFCHTEYHTEFTKKYRRAENCFHLPFTQFDDLTDLPGAERKKQAKTLLGLDSSRKVVLTVATREKYIPNGRYNYFDVITNLADQHPDTDFFIVGLNPGDPLVLPTKNINRIHVCGYVTDLTTHYLAADICLEAMPQPSLGVQEIAPIIGLCCPFPKFGDSKVFRSHVLDGFGHYGKYFSKPMSERVFYERMSSFLRDPNLCLSVAEEIRADYQKNRSGEMLFRKINEMYTLLGAGSHKPKELISSPLFEDEENIEIAENSEVQNLKDMSNYWKGELSVDELSRCLVRPSGPEKIDGSTPAVTVGTDPADTEESPESKKVRLVAFHLPQFHPIPENDEWWGKGFTEWRNVAKAKPLFEGHYQPQLPSDLGFYDMRLPETLQSQAELAKSAGIEAFCFWHYWFNGKLLLQRPLVDMLNSDKPDFQFCLAWANENWTRRWDGHDQEILQKQEYGGDDDDLSHFNWLLPFLKDKRSFKIDNRPVFLVYRPGDLPDHGRTLALWRAAAQAARLPGLYVIAIKAFFADRDQNWTERGFDGELIFHPNFRTIDNLIDENKIVPNGLDPARDAKIVSYHNIWHLFAEDGIETQRKDDVFTSVIPGWDNSARREQNPIILHNSNPEDFSAWLSLEINRVRRRKYDKRVVFINAWNEWAEGNHLEPDLKFGSAFIESTKSAIEHLDKPNQQDRSEALYKKAQALIESKTFDKAVNTLEEALRLNQHDSRIMNDLAVLYSIEGDDDSSIAVLNRLLNEEPQNSIAQRNLARVYLKSNRLEDGLKSYLKVLKNDVSNVEVLSVVAKLCMALGLNNDAIHFLESVRDLEPSNEDALKYLQVLSEKVQAQPTNKSQAEVHEVSAVSLVDLITSAESMIQERRYEAAESLLGKILVDFPLNRDAMNDLAVVRMLDGRSEEAERVLHRILEIDPGNKTAADNLLVLKNQKEPMASHDGSDGEARDRNISTADEYRQLIDRITSMEEFSLPAEVPEAEIGNAFRAFGEWHTRFVFNGRQYGGNNPYVNDPRIKDFLTWFPKGGRVLELGSFEASHTLRLIQSPRIDFVMGLEGKEYLVKRSQLIKAISGSEKMNFAKCNFENDDISVFGQFDVVFCAGVLYLLSKPWELIEKISSITDDLFLSTHYARSAGASLNGFEGEYHDNSPFTDPLSGLSDRSFWLTFDSLVKVLRQNGFEIRNVHHFKDWGGSPLCNISCVRRRPNRELPSANGSQNTIEHYRPTLHHPARQTEKPHMREKNPASCTPTVACMTLRKSCQYIESGLILHQNHLQICCSYHHNRGAIQIGPYTGGPFPMDLVLAKREEVKEANRTGVYHDCDGCAFLQERLWPDKPKYLISVMDISWSSACQLRCKYCYTVTSPEIAKTSTYDLYETCKEFTDNGWLSPNANIVWTGGEPTAFKRFDKTLNLLMQGNIFHRIFTNGYKYSEAVAEGVQKGRIQLICSLDASTAESYSAVKGKNYFDRVTKVCSMYAETHGDFRLKYVCLTENANHRDAVGFLNLVRRWGIKNIFLDTDLTDHDVHQPVVETLGYMLASARREGVATEFYDGVKSFPELRLPEKIEQIAYRTRLNELRDNGHRLLSFEGNRRDELTALNMVTIVPRDDETILQSTGNDPSVLLPYFELPKDHRAVMFIDITSPCEDLLQVFFIPDGQSAYTEYNSVRVGLTAGRNKLILAGFPNQGRLRGRVRLDPGFNPGTYVLHRLDVFGEGIGKDCEISEKHGDQPEKNRGENARSHSKSRSDAILVEPIAAVIGQDTG